MVCMCMNHDREIYSEIYNFEAIFYRLTQSKKVPHLEISVIVSIRNFEFES